MFKNSTYNKTYIHACAFGFLLLFTSTVTNAQALNDTINILPAKSALNDVDFSNDSQPTHSEVRITPDKSEIIHLDQDAKTIIVGNPAHLSVLADTPTTLILVAKTPGATHFTVLDKNGEIIMQRHVIVASPKKNYVRLRKSCASSEDDDCQSTSVYYCPDMCHEVQTMSNEASKGASASTNGKGNAPQSGDTPEDTPTPE